MSDTTTIDRPAADVMRGVIPYLAMDGRAAEAVEFYVRAFGAEDLGRMPDPERPERVMHVQVAINGGALMMTDHGGSDGGPRRANDFGHLQLVVEDGAAWWKRAVDAGCRVVMPYERQFWGDDMGLVEDPFGLKWGILQPGPGSAG